MGGKNCNNFFSKILCGNENFFELQESKIVNTNSTPRSEFRARFKLETTLLQRGDAKRGRASMASGVELSSGRDVILKQWRRTSGITDSELREIWRQEIRQLHRLAGFPGAREYIVGLIDSSEESDGFYLVLSPQQRLPLAYIRAQLSSTHYLSNPKTDKNRLQIWRNLRRLAAGLNILHIQGLLHRNLDEWCIFTSGEDVADFQLSGFEWSIRLSGAEVSATKKAPEFQIIHSFLKDWQSFGGIAASLLNVDVKTLISTNRRENRDLGLHLSGLERDLLYRLLRADGSDRLDGDLIDQKISAIIGTLESVSNKKESQLYFTCSLGPDSSVSRAVREASSRTIDTDDIAAQIDYIKNDLLEEPLLLYLKPQVGSVPQPRLVGANLTYILQPFRPSSGRRGGPAGSWAIAYCSTVASERPAGSSIDQQISLSDRGIQVLSLEEIYNRFAVLQGKATSWDSLANTESIEEVAGKSHAYRALLLLQVLEALFMVADIWPVTIHSADDVGDQVRLRLTARTDVERNRLSKALGILPPSRRMRELFATDTESSGEDWVLTDIGVLGDSQATDSKWRFVDLVEESGEKSVFEFQGIGPAPVGELLFLREADHAGEDRLLRRRVRALRALREHAELLEMLEDPRAGLRRTHDVPSEDGKFDALDESKQKALRSIWAVLPLFLVQGPPGVGKTRLVRELVGRRLREDPSSRILLTAQSHHAVDHLLEEVSKELSGQIHPPLIVRSRSKDRDVVFDDYDVTKQASRLVSELVGSAMVARAPQSLRNRVKRLSQSLAGRNSEQHDSTLGDRSVEALLLRSAHLVFSSTNAADLERLVDEKSQFDLSIIEEAGKATGTELISPLLLSHRRLLIGDHAQLPPFNADRLKNLLGDPQKISEALEVGSTLVGRPFRDAGMDELLEEDNDLIEACGDAAAALMLFETLVEEELSQIEKTKSTTRLPIAQRLNQQHRMHPAIARLVSASFYKDQLYTDASAAERFNKVGPIRSVDEKRLSDSPIVFIDMPYLQKQIGAKEYEKSPRFHNPTEVAAVIEVLSLLRPADTQAPSLAVLSPYREQVKRLKHELAASKAHKLGHLDEFTFEGDSESPTGTVDSFQGSEADVVVISLVRNNQRAGLRALGFLADQRRMNVLLSRAKWKLVVVTSLDFLRMQTSAQVPEGKSLDFLKKMFRTLDILTTERDQRGVPLAQVIKWADLKKGGA